MPGGTTKRFLIHMKHLVALFVRICRHIYELYNSGWQPINSCLDMVMWAPREFNAVADHCCNAELDTHSSWAACHDVDLEVAVLSEHSFRLCVDGGRRCRTEGAMGFALYSATDMEGCPAKYTLLARKGQLLTDIESSFLAEASALEWALQYLVELLRGSVTLAQQQ